MDTMTYTTIDGDGNKTENTAYILADGAEGAAELEALLEAARAKKEAQDAYKAAYAAALLADAEFHKALVAKYGKNAGDARYDNRASATPELIALRDAKHAADAAMRAASDKMPR